MTLLHGDCLELMATLPDNSVDMCLTDPPYGTTACKWDSVIPFEPMWVQLKRIVKKNGAIVLFGSQPFTSALVMSNVGMFKYEWVWDKAQSGNQMLAKFQPLKITENISVFSRGTAQYFPVMRKGKERKRGGAKKPNNTVHTFREGYATFGDNYYPTNILNYPNCVDKAQNVHPTQKPVALCEYLIRTYTNAGETVLDFTMGSGTTGVACVKQGREFIGIERDDKYFAIAKERIEREEAQVRMFV